MDMELSYDANRFSPLSGIYKVAARSISSNDA